MVHHQHCCLLANAKETIVILEYERANGTFVRDKLLHHGSSGNGVCLLHRHVGFGLIRVFGRIDLDIQR